MNDNWYLLGNNTKPNSLGGFENDAFSDYKEDAFFETLDTDLANNVIVYNSDLSEKIELRCIVQDNTADTMLKSMQRNILAPIGTLKTGFYVYFDESYWLVDGRVGSNGIYEKATMKICQYCLKWQNSEGELIERWAYLETASKYDVGLERRNAIIVSSNNFTVWLPSDKETLDIDGKRLFIDSRTDNPSKIFKLTRTDDVLFLYNSKGGVLSLIADRSEYNPNTDNKELMLCDYIPTDTITKNIKEEYIPYYKIKMLFSGSKVIKPSMVKKITASLLDIEGNKIEDCVYKWELESDFINYVDYLIDNDTITIKLSDDFDDVGDLVVKVSSNNTNCSDTFSLEVEV